MADDDTSKFSLDASGYVDELKDIIKGNDALVNSLSTLASKFTETFNSAGQIVKQFLTTQVNANTKLKASLVSTEDGQKAFNYSITETASKYNEFTEAARKYAVQLFKLAEAQDKASPRAKDYGGSPTKSNLSNIAKDAEKLNEALKKSELSANDLGRLLNNLNTGKPLGNVTEAAATKAGTLFLRFQETVNKSKLTDKQGFLKDTIGYLTSIQNLGATAAKTFGDNFAKTLISPAKLKLALPGDVLDFQAVGEHYYNTLQQSTIKGKKELDKLFTQFRGGDFVNLTAEQRPIGKAYLQLKEAKASLLSTIGAANAPIQNLTADRRKEVDQYTAKIKDVSQTKIGPPITSSLDPSKIIAFQTQYTKSLQAIGIEAQSFGATNKQLKESFEAALSGTKAPDGLGALTQKYRELIVLIKQFELSSEKAFAKQQAGANKTATTPIKNLNIDERKELDQFITKAKDITQSKIGPSVSASLDTTKIANFQNSYTKAFQTIGREAKFLNATNDQLQQSFDAAYGNTKAPDGLEKLTQTFRNLILLTKQLELSSEKAGNALLNAANKARLPDANVDALTRRKATTQANIPSAFNTVESSATAKFGQLSSTATFSQRQQANELINKITLSLASGKITLNEYSQALSDVGKKQFLSPNINPAINAVRHNIAQLGTVLQGTSQRVGIFAQAFLKIEDVTRIFGRLQIYRVFSEINKVLAEATQHATDFGLKIALIKTITQDAPATTEAWSKSLLQLSNNLGRPVTEVATAAYDALSNQVTKGREDTEKFLDTTINFSRTVGTDSPTAVNLFTTAIKGFGVDVSESEHIASLFFNTIDYGRITAEGLNATLGRIAPLAKDLGVSLEEVGAAQVLLTRQGFNPQEAGTRVANYLLAFEKPTKEFEKFIAGFGAQTPKQFLAVTGGLSGSISEIAKAAESGNIAIKDLFPEIRKLQAALGLGTEGGRQFAQALSDVTGNLERYLEAQKITKEPFAQKAREELTRLSNAILQVAQVAQAAFVNISNTVGGLTDKLILLGRIVIEIGATFLAFKAGNLAIAASIAGVTSLITAYKNLKLAIAAVLAGSASALPLGAGALAGLAGGVSLASFVATLAILNRINESYHNFIEEAKKKIELGLEKSFDGLKNNLNNLTGFASAKSKEINQIYAQQAAAGIIILTKQFNKHKELLDDVKKKTENTFKTTVQFLEEGIQGIERAAKKASTFAQEAKQNVQVAQYNYGKEYFDRRVADARNRFQQFGGQGLGPEEANLTLQRYNQIIALAKQASKQFETDPLAVEKLNAALTESKNLLQGLYSPNLHALDRVNLEREMYKLLQFESAEYEKHRTIQAANAAQLEEKAKKERIRLKNIEDLGDKIFNTTLVDKKTGEFVKPEITKGIETKSADKVAVDIVDKFDKNVEKLLSEINAQQKSLHQEPLSGFQQRLGFKEATDKVRQTLVDDLKSFRKGTIEQGIIGQRTANVEIGANKLVENVTKANTAIDAQKAEITVLQTQYDDLIKKAELYAIATGKSLKGNLIGDLFTGQTSASNIFNPKLFDPYINKFGELLKSIKELREQPGGPDKAISNVEAFRQSLPPDYLKREVTTGRDSGGDIKATIEQVLDSIKVQLQGTRNIPENIDKGQNNLTNLNRELNNLRAHIDPISGALSGTTQAFNTFTESLLKNTGRLGSVIDKITVNINNAADSIRTFASKPTNYNYLGTSNPGNEEYLQSLPSKAPVPAKAMGGMITSYYYSGGNIFKPKGTDTVPAMLTPGEYVIPAKQTKKYLNILSRMRTGNYAEGGIVSYFEEGGESDQRARNIVDEDRARRDMRLGDTADLKLLYHILRDTGENSSLVSQIYEYLIKKDSVFQITGQSQGGLIGNYAQGGIVGNGIADHLSYNYSSGGMVDFNNYAPKQLNPTYFNQGGSVSHSNTNFDGGIHVNIQGDTKDPNFGRTIAQEIRKELRKGTIKFS